MHEDVAPESTRKEAKTSLRDTDAEIEDDGLATEEPRASLVAPLEV